MAEKDGTIMAINITYLEHFIIAADYLNFTMAAERLFMNQSTLSRQIKALEDECGTPLFIRNGRTLVLTKAGRALYDAGRPLLTHLERISDVVANSAAYSDQSLNIYSVPAYFDELTEVYRRLKKKLGKVNISLNHMQQQDLNALLDTNSADFLITYEAFTPHAARYVSMPFHREGFVMVCAPDSPYVGRESVTIEEVSQENILFGKDFFFSVARGAAESLLGHLPEQHLTKALPSYYAPVLLGEGILVLPACARREFASDLCYIPIDAPGTEHNVCLVYKREPVYSSLFRMFINELKAVRNPEHFPVEE